MGDGRVASTRADGGDAPRSWAHGWLSDSGLLIASQTLTVIATSFAAITIARLLEPADWGVFSALLGLSLALTLVADFGLGTWLLRELSRLFAEDRRAEARARAGKLVCSGIAVNGLVALPLIVGALAWAVIARPGASVSVALVSLLLYGMLLATANALEATLRAQRRVRLVFATSLVEKSALVALLVAAVIFDLGLAAVGGAYLAAGTSRVAFDAVVVFAAHRTPFAVPHPRAAVNVARASLPFALNAASLNLVPRLDTAVLLAMSTTTAAWYAIGDRVLGPALVISATFGSALYPFMATHAAKRTQPWKLAGALGLLGAALAAIAILVAPYVVPLLFGAAYEDAVPVTQVMLLMLPLAYATSPLLVVTYSHGREKALVVPVLAISLAGTLAIAIGQAAAGAQGAATGFVARSALFLLVVGVIARAAWQREETTSEQELRAGSVSVSAPLS